MSTKPMFFPTPSDFRAWFESHHDKFQELFVGFHKKSSGKPSIIWPESVQVALCFGWIDGVRKSLDETSYMIRFTPRKQNSLGILPFSSSLVPKGDHLVGHQREKGRNKTQAAFSADRAFAESPDYAAAHAREEEVTSSAVM